MRENNKIRSGSKNRKKFKTTGYIQNVHDKNEFIWYRESLKVISKKALIKIRWNNTRKSITFNKEDEIKRKNKREYRWKKKK